MAMRKVLSIALAASTVAGAVAYNPYTTSLFLNEANGNPNNTTVIDAATIGKVGFDTIKVILKPQSSGPAFYFQPFTGILAMKIEDPKASQAVDRDFFCVELERDLFGGASDYQKYNAKGKVGWLVNQVDSSNRNNAIAMAGLQLAIWEVAYDGANNNAYDLSDGIFRTDPLFDLFADQQAAKQAAQNWLAALSNYQGTQNYFYYRSPANIRTKSDYQDLVSAVPEPTTIAALAVGAVCVIRRRRKA